MSSNSSIFSGTSRYSSDFQQIIDRAVSIASLPKAQLENIKSELSSQSSALGTLDSKFEAFQSALANLGTARLSQSTVTSDGTVASAAVSSGALAGVYQFEVVELGSYSQAMSKDELSSQVTDPFTETISSASEFTLAVDGEEYSIVPAEATLAELAEAINSIGAAVEATIVNIGPASDPDYRLSLRSTKLGEVSVQLSDGSTDLLDTTATGTLAEYRVNGQPAAAITSDSRSVTIAPGLTMTMLKEGSTTVTVSHNVASLSNSMSAVASAYNAAVAEIDKHRGKDAGVLEGSSLLYTASQALRDIILYDSGAEGISSLASLGMEFDDSGKLSLDMVAFGNASTGDFEKIEGFLGSAATSGFLKYAADITAGLQENTTGVFDVAITSLKDQIVLQDSRLAEEEDRLTQLEENLVARMAAADAMIASLERQVTYMTGLFESMRNYGNNL